MSRVYDALRRAEQASVPPFTLPLRSVPRRRGPIGLAAAAAVALMVAGGVWITRGDASDPFAALEIDLASTRWKSPTDFLLDAPAMDFFGSAAVLPVDSLAGTSTRIEPADTAIPEDLL